MAVAIVAETLGFLPFYRSLWGSGFRRATVNAVVVLDLRPAAWPRQEPAQSA